MAENEITSMNSPQGEGSSISFPVYEALTKLDQRHKEDIEHLRSFVIERVDSIQATLVRDYAAKEEVRELKVQLNQLKEDMSAIKTDVGNVRGDVSNVRGDISGTQTQIEKVETSILAKIKEMGEEIKDVNKKQNEKQVSDLRRIIYVQSIPLGILASLIVGAIFEFLKH